MAEGKGEIMTEEVGVLVPGVMAVLRAEDMDELMAGGMRVLNTEGIHKLMSEGICEVIIERMVN